MGRNYLISQYLLADFGLQDRARTTWKNLRLNPSLSGWCVAVRNVRPSRPIRTSQNLTFSGSFLDIIRTGDTRKPGFRQFFGPLWVVGGPQV